MLVVSLGEVRVRVRVRVMDLENRRREMEDAPVITYKFICIHESR